MSHIINTGPLTPIQQTAARYAAQANQQWLQLAQLFANLTKFIYSNPAGPQAAFDAFGTSASDLFTMGAAYAALVRAWLPCLLFQSGPPSSRMRMAPLHTPTPPRRLPQPPNQEILWPHKAC